MKVNKSGREVVNLFRTYFGFADIGRRRGSRSRGFLARTTYIRDIVYIFFREISRLSRNKLRAHRVARSQLARLPTCPRNVGRHTLLVFLAARGRHGETYLPAGLNSSV